MTPQDAQVQDFARDPLATMPGCVLLANGERRLWARMTEQERRDYLAEGRRARAAANAHKSETVVSKTSPCSAI